MALATKKRTVRHLRPYRTYRFTDYDPIIDKVCNAVDASGQKVAEIHKNSGVSTTTYYNWSRKKTKRPQFATVNAVLMAVGSELVIVRRK